MKYKFLMCIRPVVTQAENNEQRYVTLSRERSNRSKKTSPGGSISGRDSSRRQESVVGSHKTFSQAIQAVLFEVTLRRSVRERNIVQPTPRTNSNSSRKSSCLDRSRDESVTRKPYRTQPELRQHLPTSPKTPTGQSKSLNPKKQSTSSEEATCGISCCSNAMYLFVISLFATILWGKIFGVLCTSIWLYMVPRRSNHSGRRLEKLGKLPPEIEEEMVEYKKRVVMEGFLERNHRKDGERH